MTRPRFLSLGPDEIAELRGTLGVELIIEWLEWEREQARELVLTATVTGGDPKLRAGSSVTFDHILKRLKTPAPIAEISDDDFIDPARRPSRKDRDDSQSERASR